MSVPTCPYCARTFDDRRGCDFVDDDPRPLPYGSETEGYADLRGWTVADLTAADECADCGAPKGTDHHVECLRSECAACHHQFGLCGGTECDEVWRWSTGLEHPERRPAA